LFSIVRTKLLHAQVELGIFSFPMAYQGAFVGVYAFTRWGDFFVDENVAVPIVDRLIHHAQIFMLGGESYRLKQKMGGSSMVGVGQN
jgi:DNA replication protein DnaC